MTTIVVDKRTQIIETALMLFTTQGLQQTSMSQISKVSGVAVGTIYLNFKSKDELIEGIFLHIQENFGKAVALDEEETKLPFGGQFRLICHKAVDFYINNPYQFYFIDTSNYSPLISQETREKGRRFYDQAISILSKGMDDGRIQKMPLVLLIRYVYNTIVTMVQVVLNDKMPLTEEIKDQTINILMRGLR